MSINPARPGFNLGFEYGLKDKVKFQSKVVPGKGSQNHVRVNQVIAAVNAGSIWHPKTSLSILNTYTLEVRRTTKRKFQYQLGAGPGYFYSFFPNVYSVSSDGNVKSLPFAGRGFFAPTSFVGFGVFRKESHKFQWWHFRVSNTLLTNYNGFAIPYVLCELRLGFHKKPVGQ